MPYPTTLDDSPALTVTGLSLQLKVRHACGTCHAYIIRFDIASESGVESQLNDDLSHLIELMRNRANYGEYEVNGRKYFAIEVPDTNDAITRMLSDEMPAIVLPTQEQESQSVASSEEAEREPNKAQSESEPQSSPAAPAEPRSPDERESMVNRPSEPTQEPPPPEAPPEPEVSPPVDDVKDEAPKTEVKSEPEQRAAEEHKLAAQEHDMAAREHRLAESQKQDEQKQETTTDEPTSGLSFLSRKGRRGRGK